MEYHRWFVGILKENLSEDGPKDRGRDESDGQSEEEQAFR